MRYGSRLLRWKAPVFQHPSASVYALSANIRWKFCEHLGLRCPSYTYVSSQNGLSNDSAWTRNSNSPGKFRAACATTAVHDAVEHEARLTPTPIPLAPGEVHIWWLKAEQVQSAALQEQYLQLLPEEEKKYVQEGASPQVRKERLLAKILVRMTLARYCREDISPSLLSFESSPNGKPWLVSEHGCTIDGKALHFNLTHTSELLGDFHMVSIPCPKTSCGFLHVPHSPVEQMIRPHDIYRNHHRRKKDTSSVRFTMSNGNTISIRLHFKVPSLQALRKTKLPFRCRQVLEVNLRGIAVARERLVGLDVESSSRLTKADPLRLAARRFSEQEFAILKGFDDPGERARLFLRLWTLKEAYVKATGRGISAPPGLKGFTFELLLQTSAGPKSCLKQPRMQSNGSNAAALLGKENIPAFGQAQGRRPPQTADDSYQDELQAKEEGRVGHGGAKIRAIADQDLPFLVRFRAAEIDAHGWEAVLMELSGGHTAALVVEGENNGTQEPQTAPKPPLRLRLFHSIPLVSEQEVSEQHFRLIGYGRSE